MKTIINYTTKFLFAALFLCSCQKLDRPVLGDYPTDPPVPPYDPLKSFLAFENNATDAGENKLEVTASNVTYAAGITGQAAKIGPGGYLLFNNLSQSNQDQNGFVSTPADTLVNLGSFTISFWMNGVGPVQGGAQGIFAISHKAQFWGNLEVFLENYSDPADPNAAWIKIHMFNAGVASGNGEEWTADDAMKLPNVLNRWTHIAITYDAATSKLSVYKDGAPTSTYNKTLGGGNYGEIKYNDFNGLVIGTFQFQTNPTLSNHGPEAWAKSFDGSLDQFRIYNKALSDAEILALFTGKL